MTNLMLLDYHLFTILKDTVLDSFFLVEVELKRYCIKVTGKSNMF